MFDWISHHRTVSPPFPFPFPSIHLFIPFRAIFPFQCRPIAHCHHHILIHPLNQCAAVAPVCALLFFLTILSFAHQHYQSSLILYICYRHYVGFLPFDFFVMVGFSSTQTCLSLDANFHSMMMCSERYHYHHPSSCVCKCTTVPCIVAHFMPSSTSHYCTVV